MLLTCLSHQEFLKSNEIERSHWRQKLPPAVEISLNSKGFQTLFSLQSFDIYYMFKFSVNNNNHTNHVQNHGRILLYLEDEYMLFYANELTFYYL